VTFGILLADELLASSDICAKIIITQNQTFPSLQNQVIKQFLSMGLYKTVKPEALGIRGNILNCCLWPWDNSSEVTLSTSGPQFECSTKPMK